MKNTSLKYQLNTRIVLAICLFSLILFSFSYFSMISLVKSTIEKNVENSIDFAKKFCTQKNHVLQILTDGAVNQKDFYKIARYQVITVMNMIRFGKGGFIWFNDAEGVIRIHPDNALINGKIPANSLNQFILNINKDGNIYSTRLGNNVYYVSYFSLWKLYIVLEANYDELFSLVFFLRNLSIFILLAFLITIYFITRLIAQKISKPIENLSQISSEILNGADARSFSWPQDGCLEVKNLGSALKSLIEDLYIKNRELSDKNDALAEAYQKEQSAREELETAFEELEATHEELEITNQELEQTNQKLDNALGNANEGNRIKEELLALMSHEIKTPLTGILGFTNILLKDTEPGTGSNFQHQHILYLEYIFKSASRLNDLLTNLLLLSAEMAGKQVNLKFEFFNIEQMINDIFIMLNMNMLDQANQLSCEIDCDKIILADSIRLQQILYNLIGNALKFTRNGTIKVQVQQKENHYLFSVQDTGIGIEKSNQEIIFDIFRQIDSSKTRKYQGAGIGLSVCKRFVSILGGNIWVESDIGHGSTFYFTIPIKDYSPIDISQDMAVEKPISFSHLKVLFAEDDIANLALIKKLLTNINPEKATGFLNGPELLEEFAKDSDYTLILLDIQMPGMNGVDCLHEIRKIHKTIPVIALTAYSMKEDREIFISLGFTEYLEKPFNFDDLYRTIYKTVSQAIA